MFCAFQVIPFAFPPASFKFIYLYSTGLTYSTAEMEWTVEDIMPYEPLSVSCSVHPVEVLNAVRELSSMNIFDIAFE